MSLIGLHSILSSAMVLASVDTLSDEDPPRATGGSAASTPKPKPKASSKPTAKAKGKGSASAKKKPATEKAAPSKPTNSNKKTMEAEETKEDPPLEDEAEEDDGDEDCDVIPKKKPATNSTKKTKVLKRPAAAAKPKPFSVYKYRYPTGKYGFKVNGKEVMGVTRLNIIPCHKNSVEMFVILIYEDHARPISAQVKPVSGLNEVMETIAEARISNCQLQSLMWCYVPSCFCLLGVMSRQPLFSNVNPKTSGLLCAKDAVKAELVRTKGEVSKGRELAVPCLKGFQH